MKQENTVTFLRNELLVLDPRFRGDDANSVGFVVEITLKETLIFWRIA
jgi:hypothetical protein